MSNFTSGISNEHFQRLQELLGRELNPETNPEGKDPQADCGRVISLEEFRQKSRHEQEERDKARSRARALLQVIAQICRDYEAHMLTIAHSKGREEWVEETGSDPYEQIQYDMFRLKNFIEALHLALDDKGAATLGEAVAELESWGTQEIQETMEYLFNSDYFGFRCLKQLFNVGEISDGQYQEEKAILEDVQEDLVDGGYVFSVEPIRSLASQEALGPQIIRTRERLGGWLKFFYREAPGVFVE